MPRKITKRNYYSKKSALEYCGYSQFKNFCGAGGAKGCEAQALAILNGTWEPEPSTSMLVGSYVDAWFEGTLSKFEEEHAADIFNKKGDYYAPFQKARECIERVKKDPLFMKFMGGKHQVIMTANFFDTDWKIKMDSFHKGKCIVDLKVVEDLRKTFFVPDMGKLNFIDFWGYEVQGAIYQKVVEINTGEKLPFFIAAVDKGKYPDIEIIQIPNNKLANALEVIEYEIKRLNRVKSGEIEPIRCGTCDYCKATKILTSPILVDELVNGTF